MEDLPVKAIVIGVSVFVTMAVLSAILMYFNTARELADKVTNRVDIADTFDSIMNEDIDADYLTGVEVRSLITKHAGSEYITINIVAINGEEVEDEVYKNVNNKWYENLNLTYAPAAKLISEEQLDLINPAYKCKVEKIKEGENITLNLRLNVEE